MAATTWNESINALLTTTSKNYHKAGVITDNIFNSNALFHALHDKGEGIRMEDVGGDHIKVGLMYEGNGNVKAYAGTEVLDDTMQDGMTAAYYAWKQYSGANVLDGISKFKNSGKAKIVSLWREKTKQTLGQFGELMNQHLLDVANLSAAGATGGSGKWINSIPLLVQKDPTDGQDVGGVDQSAETWWRNKYQDSATESTATTQQLYTEMLNLYNTCGRGGGGSPDILLADQVTFQKYVIHMDNKIRYEHTDTASAGFENVRFLGAKMFWDVYVPDANAGTNGGPTTTLTDGTIYMLNSKHLSLYVGKGFDFAPQGVRQAERQDIIREYFLFYGQLVTDARRKHGVLFDINPAIALS